MKNSTYTELLIFAIIIIPAIYLLLIWADLPEEVPMHWNASGEIDRYGSKNELVGLLFMLNLPLYVILKYAPKIDPKKKISETQLAGLRLVMHLFMSAMAVFILYSTKQAELSSPFGLVSIVGLLFAGLGWYFPRIKPNYFIGIKTPWTLENDEVWQRTHKASGPVWIVGGILMAIVPLVAEKASIYAVLGITLLLSIYSVGYSYWAFKNPLPN
ncbi:MAG: SdpI family protein [Bacteroidetes bacterium]|nr:SdpI family protein [Bacteroidota bacterium]